MEWEMYQIERQIRVYRAVVRLNSWTTYMFHINQLDVFHKNWLHATCSYTVHDMILNDDDLAKCNISGIETFMMQLELSQEGHVARMSEIKLTASCVGILTAEKGMLDSRGSGIKTS